LDKVDIVAVVAVEEKCCSGNLRLRWQEKVRNKNWIGLNNVEKDGLLQVI